MGRAVLAACLAGVAAGLGCLPSPTFDCTDSTECGTGGTCQPDDRCSFADSSCTSGQRYGSLAGNESNACVAAGSGSSSCTGFSALKGNGTGNGHLFLQLGASAAWGTAVSECVALGGFLAVPATQQELNAILNVTCVDTWMGIHEVGSAFETPTGTPVPFLPWDCNQPDGSDGSCVSAVDNDDAYALADCTASEAVMCECIPD
jgi:hypothetical protein